MYNILETFAFGIAGGKEQKHSGQTIRCQRTEGDVKGAETCVCAMDRSSYWPKQGQP